MKLSRRSRFVNGFRELINCIKPFTYVYNKVNEFTYFDEKLKRY